LGKKLGAAEDGLQALPNQAMVVNNKNFHRVEYYLKTAVDRFVSLGKPHEA
jgi:Na+-translocating ferredoxin:NAD+ oxidoreductase RNF subunit RnfB